MPLCQVPGGGHCRGASLYVGCLFGRMGPTGLLLHSGRTGALRGEGGDWDWVGGGGGVAQGLGGGGIPGSQGRAANETHDSDIQPPDPQQVPPGGGGGMKQQILSDRTPL